MKCTQINGSIKYGNPFKGIFLKGFNFAPFKDKF